MSGRSTENTPRERLSRLINVLKRVRMYWRSTAAIAAIGVAISLAVALNSKRIWRSETTILYRDTIQTGRDAQESAAARAARLGPKLKDMLYARGKLSSVIEQLGLYPEKTAKSMVEAVEEMQSHVGFRARNSDTYVISFTHDDPVVAQQVTARLAELLIDDYRRENLGAAEMTRDFLRRELDETSGQVEAASRALAMFLAQNPQFQWGTNDNPYAPVPQIPGAGPQPAARPEVPRVARPADPELASLERRLAQVEAQLAPPSAAVPAGQALPPNVAEAQKARDAAASAVAAAEAALAERLQTVTPIHPDAVSAKNRVEVARQQLAAAESALRLLRTGGGDPDAAPAVELSPERQAQLSSERRALLSQIASRRAQLSSGAPADAGGSAGAAAQPGADPKAASGPADPRKSIVELETEWHRLRLELDRARDHLKTVQANERAANLSADAAEKTSDVEMAVLDPAYLPTRPDKGRGRIFFAGAAFAVFLALGLAGARVLLNDTLYDGDDVNALGGPAMLAAMPEMPEEKPLPPRSIVPAPGIEVSGPGGAAPVEEGAARGAAVGGAAPLLPVPPARPRTETIRFGNPPVAAAAPPQAVDREAALALMGSYAMARLEAALHEEEPEVEVIGADVDPSGRGVFELLGDVPPAALAALRVLRHRLDQRRGDDHLVVSVVSPRHGEGKTTLAARLAMTLAESQRARVVLVEGNLERPRVAATLGLRLPHQVGLSHQIRQRMQGSTAPLGVVQVGPSLYVLAEPLAEAAYPAALHSTHFEAALRTLRQHYDYVVIDGPAVLGSGDANVIEDASDGVILVARASVTQGTELSKAAEQLGERRILGVVLNDVTDKPVAKKRIKPPMAVGQQQQHQQQAA